MAVLTKGDVRMKRFLCGLLCLVLLAGILPVLAEEEDDQLSQEELDAERAELEQLDAEDDSIYEVTGKVYP